MAVDPQILLIASSIAAGISLYGLKKKSLSPSGAAAALIVGTIHFTCGVHFGLTLIFFFLASSKLTKYKSAFKAKVEEDFRENGQRNAWQVLANGFGGCVFALLAARWQATDAALARTATAGFLGHYACCCGDTFSSELGILSKRDPILITTGKAVPRGTNGGVSPFGTLAGALGGLFIGSSLWITSRWAANAGSSTPIGIIPLGLFLGLAGTFLDSLLGATCQYTGYSSELGRVVGVSGPGVQHISGKPLLSNDMVNFVAATLTAILGAFNAYLVQSLPEVVGG